MPLYLPHFNLQKLNTLAVPAITDWFVTVSTEQELREALAYARERAIPYLILGGGSNLILRDNFPGLVIQLQTKGKTLVQETDAHLWLRVAAGENWQELVEYSLAQGFYGLENLSLIPGCVGAAPIQNIGAYGVELKDVFAELTALEVASGIAVTFTPESCQFGYRESVFKQSLKDKYVITSVTFKLHKTPKLMLEYPALRQAFGSLDESEISPQQVSDAVIAIRQAKLPDPLVTPNVGSFFKNPVVSQERLEQLRQSYPDIVSFPFAQGQVKLAAGWLIDKAGWRGAELAGARVHEQQALVLTNPNRLVGGAVLKLAQAIKADIVEKFNVELEVEPRVYP